MTQENGKVCVTKSFPQLKGETECFGCGACIAVCGQGAISLRGVGMGASLPVVSKELCIGCSLCGKACQGKRESAVREHAAYIALNKDAIQRYASASGGAFSAMASHVLSLGGVVFGVEMKFPAEGVVIQHRMIDNLQDLNCILGSKYVFSDCSDAMRRARKQLKSGKLVLFSGTSCQIDGLYRYLGADDISNLYTIDLICHGVPGNELFRQRIEYLEHKYRGKARHYDFRVKRDGQIFFEETVCIEIGGKLKEISISSDQSAYYHMFRNQESYRLACYHCPYATINKPADITIGDYFEALRDYPYLFKGDGALDTKNGLSCLITHSDKGRKLMADSCSRLQLIQVDCDTVCSSHRNLTKPSQYTHRDKLLAIYLQEGYNGLERHDARQRPMRRLRRIIIWLWKRIRTLRGVKRLRKAAGHHNKKGSLE